MPKDDLDSSLPTSLLRNQDRSTVQDLLNYEAQLESTRNKFFRKLHEYIGQIQSKLVALKSEVHSDYTMELRDADYYRVNMFQLEGKITQLKQSITIELCNVLKEESELSKDLQYMERRVEEWGKQQASVRTVKSAAHTYKSGNVDSGDLSEFHKFLSASGGHTGGWDEQDHLLFLRERRKFNARPKFIHSVHCLLPDISEELISEHENWYKKYETLKNEQKDAIKKWRATKQSSLEKRQESSADERDGSAQKPRNYAAQRDITERIKEWKRQQLIKKAEEEERMREEQQRQNEERLRKREIQKAKKSAVNAYKAEKISRMQTESLSQQLKELQALEDRAKKSVMLRTFREQDQQLLERRKMQKLQNEWKEKQRQERLKNVKPAINLTVDRDPQRILQATQTWQQRVNQQSEGVSTAVQALSLHTIPHLAVPTWRRGLDHTQTL